MEHARTSNKPVTSPGHKLTSRLHRIRGVPHSTLPRSNTHSISSFPSSLPSNLFSKTLPFPLLIRTPGPDLWRTPDNPVVALTPVTFKTNTDRHSIIHRPRLQPAYHLDHRTPRSRSSCSVILTVCSGTPVPSSCVCFSCVSLTYSKSNVQMPQPLALHMAVLVSLFCLCLSLSVSLSLSLFCLCLSLPCLFRHSPPSLIIPEQVRFGP